MTAPARPTVPRPAPPVAITGVGCISAAGTTLADNLAALDQGRRDPKPPVLFPTEKPYPVFMASLPEHADFPFLPDSGGLAAYSRTVRLASYSRTVRLASYSRTVRLAAHAAGEALRDAGLDPEELPRLKVGVCLGTSVGTALDFYDYYTELRAGNTPSMSVIHQYLASNPSLALARLLRLNGPVQTVANACSSGADGIGLGAEWIRTGLCDVVLCGGADALAQVIYYGFSSLQLQSPEPCTPFDKNRKGLNLGEGAGILVLESEKRAANRARIGTVAGYGTCTDAWHLTAPHPEARGLANALDQALSQAGALERDIAFINAHGTATPTNDAAEAKFFRARFAGTPFVATKGCTGHTLGAAGAVEAVFTLAHFARALLPASAGFAETDPKLGVAPVSSPTAVDGALAMSQSLAFGGNNSVLLFGKGDRP